MEYLVGGIAGFVIGLITGVLLICLCMANGKDNE